MSEEKLSDLELLIRQADIHQEKARQIIDRSAKVSRPIRADKNARLFDAIVMISDLVKKSLLDLHVEFMTDDERYVLRDPDIKVDHPFITYRVKSRRPKEEIKPRVRETINDASFVGEIYGQKFSCIVQFNIFGNTANDAEQVMSRFEEMIFTYTGYLKRNGVAEIIFDEQTTGDEYNNFREITSIRSITYKIEIEHLYNVLHNNIIDIDMHDIEFPESVGSPT